MKLERLTVVPALALALTAAACGADRSKEVRSAATELTSERHEARADQTRLAEEHAREQALQRAITAKEDAELRTKQLEEQAEVRAEGTKEIAEARKDLVAAQAALEAERVKVEADAKERLNKANAKAMEARSLTGHVPADERAQFDAEMNTFEAKKAEVQSRLSNLSRAGVTEWNEAKQKLDKSLDHLEQIAERIDDHL